MPRRRRYSRSRKRVLHSILFLLVMAEPVAEPPALAEPTAPAEDHAAVAAKAFREGEFVRAAEAFARAYAATGDPALLFGRAQALRRAGSCAAAIDVFEEFIAAAPPAADAEAAQGSIDECRAILEAHSDPTVDPPPPDPIDEPIAPPTTPAPKWHRDVTGGVLLGSGLAIVAVGAALYGTSFSLADERGGTEQAYESRTRRVRTFSATGAGLMIGGGMVIVGAIVRYAVVAKRQRSTRLAWHGPLSLRF